MIRFFPLLIGLSALLLPFLASAALERTLEHSFAVAPDHRVNVQLPGGAIRITVVDQPTVRVRLVQEIRAQDDAKADALLTDYGIEIGQDGDTVNLTVTAPGRRAVSWFTWRSAVQFTAHLEVPPHVALDLRTSGGSITLTGRHTHAFNARTSGGSIRAEGSTGPADLRTSGGSILVDEAGGTMHLATSGGTIRVGTVEGALRAATSGGSIRVGHVGRDATTLDVRTSGGSITLGVDPTSNWNLDAATSGGSVRVRGLAFAATTENRSRAEGTINAGGNSLRARTSGGSVTVSASTAPAEK